MNTTRVFSETAKAYNSGARIIANVGGSRSSKTFSELQLFKFIMDNSKRQRIITTVSHSFPHLAGGAIRDFDKILIDDGVNIDSVRVKNPHIYTIGKSIHEFVGFDKPGKTLGSARDILFVNEANKMPWSIVHQLIMRTTEVVFLDWNPAEEFWFHEQGIQDRKDCRIIHSTFFDNIQNLTQGQLEEFRIGRTRALAEDKAGKRGYWWNWWQVYGLGLPGQLEGVIFQNWKEYSMLRDVELFRMWVIDWGGNDPTTLTELNIDGHNNKLYIKEHIYQPQILNSKLIDYINEHNQENDFVICDSARKDKIYELQMAQINAYGSTKGEGSIIDGIERMMEFDIFVHESSENAKNEFNKYKWAKDKITGKNLNVPEDDYNHIIDGVRYGLRFYKKNIKPN